MKTRVLGLCAAVLLTFWAGTSLARAQILLQIDVSDPNTIKFIATTGASSASTSDFLYFDGIDLTGFLTQAVTPITAATSIGSDLKPTLSDNSYFGIFVDNLSGSYQDINLFSNFFATEEFEAGTQAFSGALLWDTSSSDYTEIRSALPLAGATGTVYAGTGIDLEFSETPIAIGTWEVVGAAAAVPEPSIDALGFCGGMMLLGYSLWRRARQRA